MPKLELVSDQDFWSGTYAGRHIAIFSEHGHVIEAVAAAAERIFQEADETCIVATSREPLRVAGERVHR